MQQQQLPSSRYLEFFKQNEEGVRSALELVGNVILVERIRPPEARTASGLYIAEGPQKQINTLVSDRPTFYRVLMTGEGYYDGEGNDVSLNCKPGDIVLLGQASVRLFSSFPLLTSYEPDSIGYSTDEEARIRFKGQESFERVVGDLDEFVKKQMAAQKQATGNPV